jgi:YbbR domain-containing protein
MIKDGYSVEKPIMKPSVVQVTGAKEAIDNISFVEARVDLQNASDTIKQESKVAAYDQNGNVVDVEIEPAVVEVTVPITSPSKVVPFKINRKGILKGGLSIVSIESIPSEVTIYGSKDSLEKIDMIDGINIDLDNISDDTVLEIPVPKPDGVKKVSPEKIKVKIDIEKQIKKTLTNIPISINGLRDNQDGLISNPENAIMNVDIFGAKSVIDKVKPNDIKIFVNVANLELGEHQINLEVSGPQNISWEIPKDTATVVISNKGE